MNKLPKVFINSVDSIIDNSMNRVEVKEQNISIDNILSKDKYSFNHVYEITLRDKVIKDSIIQILNNKILTIDNSWINKNDIINIKEIKK